ncbi:RNA polymerase sigma-70 factor, ECF subfamily [Sinomicrobium oceani]|uniref:RNA polymerase sigma-70 factor, ECF subfamily n=1 Tax=Sinomicrobium oceani TaxID=1150368 RepID=A0A1K1MAS8_9FLAO|nr:RNA polymerase sigma-70 factor [Sinomicrobium oceani]SFW20244.1 RNA polymerase sigma-70 factor, ECF subfamily [Sinomicrobium oceani]
MKRNYKETDDASLLLLIKQNEGEHAFRELFYRYQDRLYRYNQKILRNHEASEEILQDVFVKVWNYRHQIDESRDFSFLLFKIAKNTIINYLKSQKAKQQLSTETISTLATHICPEETMIWEQYVMMLDQAIAELPERCRIVFKKSRLEGKSYEEIADDLGISRNTVRLQIIKSLKLIKSYFNHHPEMDVVFTLLIAFSIVIYSF